MSTSPPPKIPPSKLAARRQRTAQRTSHLTGSEFVVIPWSPLERICRLICRHRPPKHPHKQAPIWLVSRFRPVRNLLYTEGVGGSKPSLPTKESPLLRAFCILRVVGRPLWPGICRRICRLRQRQRASMREQAVSGALEIVQVDSWNSNVSMADAHPVLDHQFGKLLAVHQDDASSST